MINKSECNVDIYLIILYSQLYNDDYQFPPRPISSMLPSKIIDYSEFFNILFLCSENIINSIELRLL